MQFLTATVRFLAAASLLLAAVQIYLTINKIWKRKHEPAVADSISIMGELIGLIPLVFLTMSFLLEGHWTGAVDTILWMLSSSVMILIGTGLWVEGRRRLGFWKLLRESVRLERREVGALARSLFRPALAPQILDILGRLAAIDGPLTDREKTFIKTFSDTWGLPVSPEALAQNGTGPTACIALRDRAAEYLATSPPVAQARQVAKVIVALAEADHPVDGDEAMMVAELGGMLAAYVDPTPVEPDFAVALVPQRNEQDQAIASVLPHVQKTPIQGGEAYVGGRYHTETFAEMVAAEYRALNIFTTVIRVSGKGTLPLTSSRPSAGHRQKTTLSA